ncbi:MAG: T9SS type A sorting domain-containing protein [Flavobacteriales bacterium]|nr:T9SS type A sorting domain-containing protein [Flavobacteriales bacterium]
MKNLKNLLIPIGLIALVIGVFSFTNHKSKNDEKCSIKIVKIVNGIKTEIDSTFDCSDKMEWISSFDGEKGKSIHKMIRMMMTEDGDSNSFSFDINIESDDEDIMELTDENGKKIEMHFDMKMLDGEDGILKMMINGKEMEVNLGNIQNHIKVLTEDIQHFEDEEGNVNIMIKSDEDGGESHTVEIIKTIDDDGKITIKKIVNGEEVELDDEDIMKMDGGHKMIFISDNADIKNMDGNHEMTIDINVESEDGKKTKQIVIISKITTSETSSDEISTAVDLDKKELSIKKLKFSPNPNNGKFELNFKLDDEKPVHIKIVDIQGKEVYNEMVNDFNGKYSNNIDISGNGDGIYILQVVQGDKASTSKIVIK